MGLLDRGDIASLVQNHPVHLANDVLWITGDMETQGNPHNYINQEGLSFLRINDPQIAPWSFTGLPLSRTPSLIAARERTQLVIFPGEEAMEQFRPPMNTESLMINLSLAVVHGKVPFLSEAQIHNFLDFWKGIFFPVIDAELYFLADGPVELPATAPLTYVNRNVIQSYVEG